MADRSVVYRLTADVSGLTAGMRQAAASVKKAAGDMTGAEKSAVKYRAGLDTVGTAAGKLGLVAAAGLGAAVVASANFDQAMSNVKAATHETAENMELLRAAAIKAGADTTFSATEAAAGVENLAKAGVSTADILGGGLTGALDLAAAGGLDVATAAEAAATAMTQFNLSGEDVPHIADLLAAGAGKAQGEVTDLSAALNQSGLVAGQMGLSIEETTGALSAFASAGLLGSDAGTSLKTMLLRLANPSKQAAETMADLGINAYDAQGNLVSMTDLAGQLEGAFQGMSQETRDAALATIFGSDAIRAANVLYSQGAEGIATWTNNVNDSGYAAETAATKMDNLKGDLEALKGSLETALIGTGDGAQGPLRSLVQGATDLVNAFNDLPSSAKNAAAGLAGITAIMGGGLWFTAKVIGGIAKARTALEDLGMSGDKASAALRGVAKSAAGLAALSIASQVFDELQDKASGTVPELEAMTEALLDMQAAGGSSEFAGLGTAIDRLKSAGGWDTFLDHVNEAGEKIPLLGDHVTTFLGFTAGIGPQLSEAGTEVERLGKQFEGLDAALANVVSTAGPEQAQQMFDDLAESEGLSADQTKQLLTLLPQYESAMTGVANQVRLANGELATLGGLSDLLLGPLGDTTGATDDYAGAVDDASDANDALADSIDKAVESMEKQRDAAIAAFDAETGYRQALKDAQEQAAKNDAGIKGSTDEALANRDALSSLAGSWNELSNKAQNIPGRFEAAKKSFIDVAVAMGVPRKAARDLAEQYLQIPNKVITKAEIEDREARRKATVLQGLLEKFGMTRAEAKALLDDASAKNKTKAIQGLINEYGFTKAEATALVKDLASARIAQVKQMLRDLDGDTASTFINVITRRSNEAGGFGPTYATGGPVYGPGSGTSDSIPALLSNGEYVIKAAAVAQYGRHLFDQLNAQRYAHGGFVPTTQAVIPAPSVSVGGAQVRVFIDGNEVRAVVDERINRHQSMRRGQKGYGQ